MDYFEITNLVGKCTQGEGLLSAEFTGTADLKNKQTGECIIEAKVKISDMGDICRGKYPFLYMLKEIYCFGAR